MKETDDSPSRSIEFSLLGLLGEKPMHGYELHQELSRKSGLGLIWTVKQAQLYAILSKLESKGLIAAEIIVSGMRPARKVFHLTEEGESAFSEWVRTPVSRRDFRLDFLAKLLLARKVGPEAAASLVVEQGRLCGLWLEDMRSRSTVCPEGSPDTLIYRYRVGQLEAMVTWLKECGRHFGAGEPMAAAVTSDTAR